MSSTSLFKDILVAIPVTILYLLFVHRMTELLTENIKAEERIKKHIIISFIIGIVSILIAIYIFGSKHIKNRAVKIGLIIGALLTIINSLYNNWESLEQDIKLFIVGGLFVGLITLTYFR
jgi:hypothetical protein